MKARVKSTLLKGAFQIVAIFFWNEHLFSIQLLLPVRKPAGRMSLPSELRSAGRALVPHNFDLQLLGGIPQNCGVPYLFIGAFLTYSFNA